ncbi:hypothetical protein [Mesorhizobium sp. ZC-5]|uniref:hypothetical protein n=1 Tax=Mesorhizobium sp. ZC-5 TaxID=2986066 RepID=UPI0021E6FAE3|nr:hypothetical protein [Mesorhizobium sp. ZC-5]MCV3243560.1 hypothetical protein [Mesorhizobium sp. ZC-5]
MAGLGKESLNWQSRQGLIRQTPRQFHGLGNLARFQLPPRHRFDTVGVGLLLEGIDFGGLIADKASTVIASSPISTSAAPRPSSRSIRAGPSLWRSIANSTNGDTSSRTSSSASPCEPKTDQSFSAMIHLAAAVINSR